ncbi:MAG: flagellar biosynthetic protein FliP, partial [Candidatus Hydrothermarchaeota archaeon]
MRRWVAIAVIALSLIPCLCQGQQIIPLPRITVDVGAANAENPRQLSTAIQILFLITALSLAPAFLIMMTSFTRIIVVLSFLRHGLATQQLPSNQILAGLALF